MMRHRGIPAASAQRPRSARKSRTSRRRSPYLGSGSAIRGPIRTWVATTEAPWRAQAARKVGSAKPLMSLPMQAPAASASSMTDPRKVSTEMGRSKRSRSASTAGTTRPTSEAAVTSGPGAARIPPTSRMSAPSATCRSASRRKASKSQCRPWSKKESVVRLRMPITTERCVMSTTCSGPNSRITSATVHGGGDRGPTTAASRLRTPANGEVAAEGVDLPGLPPHPDHRARGW